MHEAGAPARSSPALQHTLGNRAFSRLLGETRASLPLSAGAVLQLQRAAGNRAVSRLRERSSSSPAKADPVQRKSTGAPATEQIVSAARMGSAGSGGPLPHLAQLQRAFGPEHDLSDVRAHQGGDAVQAGALLGAEAYTMGGDVVFGGAPSLHTAAHEAAHVVQQRAGVQLAGVMGEVGDRYEQHADAVADAVVAGCSAEGLLARLVPADASRADARPTAIQRVASDYKSDTDIKAMKLSEFDRYAHAQADWAISASLGGDTDELRSILAFARKDDGLVLGGCGDFTVGDLQDMWIGQNVADKELRAYSRCASVGKNEGTIHVEAPAASVQEAIDWGEAILKLESLNVGLIFERVIPQNSTYQGLKQLVDAKAVADFIQYLCDVNPLLDAENGAEVKSYLAFRGEGGQSKYATYKLELPEIRNYHRFIVTQLDMLVANKKNATTNRAKPNPLPICAVLQTAFDHNGAFHRDPNLTRVIERTTHITLVAEGKRSRADFSNALGTFAAYGKDGKVDEVMVNGHGDAKSMEFAGASVIGQTQTGEKIYGRSRNEPITVDARSEPDDLTGTETFIQSIIAVLRDDPSARVVLNACLTASNSVDTTLDPDPVTAAQQVEAAIAQDPSLATAMQTKLGKHKAKVRGANASFGQVSLLDAGGSIDIVSSRDPKLTAPKLEYAQEGAEPTGVLRATLESWAGDKKATINVIKTRLTTRSTDTSWGETVIRALMQIILKSPDDGQLINTFTHSADALGHLTSRPDCRVSALKGKVPDAHLEDVFTTLTGSSTWTSATYAYVPLVVYQVWIEKKNSKVKDFLAFLDASSFDTQSSAPFVDLGHLNGLLVDLLPDPSPPDTPPRGSFLIALLCLIKKKGGAPDASKNYIKKVVGTGNQAFPVGSNAATLLKGATEQSVLEDAGAVQKANAAPTSNVVAGPAPNVAPTGAGDNTLAVDSVTMKCKTPSNQQTDAYTLPDGKKAGTIAGGTTLHVIGKTKGKKGTQTGVDFYAVEYTIKTDKTVFVDASEVSIV